MSCRTRLRRGFLGERMRLEAIGHPAKCTGTGEPEAASRRPLGGLLSRELLLYGVPGDQRGDRERPHCVTLLESFQDHCE
jgi:hypothetical protein